MSDQFALGLLAQLVEKQGLEIQELRARIEELEGAEDEGGLYLDGSPTR